MLAHSFLKSAGGGRLSTAIALAMLLPYSNRLNGQTQQPGELQPYTTSTTHVSQQPQPTPPKQTGQTSGNGRDGNAGATVPTSQKPSATGNHAADTYQGNSPHSSDKGPGIAAGSVAAGLIVAELINHYNKSPNKLGHDGPQVPKQFNMNGFVIKGLVYPNWPVALDFRLDSPGTVQMVITAADGHRFQATMTNTPNRRAFGIFHLPANFGTKLQTAVYQVTSLPLPGTNGPAPGLRTYGIGAGERAVGSVAIDQLTFQPATIHPQAKEVATYSYHAHSAFDGVRAEFIFTSFFNGSLVVQKEEEDKLSPIPEGERGRGTWQGRGKSGEHMLQIRAWRGLENGGDWVVAWSPDIVDVVK